METASGIIEALSENEAKTKFGPKPVYSLRIDGEWYKNGFKKIPFSKGDAVDIMYENTMYGKEITKITGAGGSTASSAPAASGGSPAPRNAYPVDIHHSSMAIIMQNAMRHVMKSLEIRGWDSVMDPVSSNDDDFWNYVYNKTVEVAMVISGNASIERDGNKEES